MGFNNNADKIYVETTTTPYSVGENKWGWTFAGNVSGGKATFEIPNTDTYPAGTRLTLVLVSGTGTIEVQAPSAIIINKSGGSIQNIGANAYGAKIVLESNGAAWVMSEGLGTWYDVDDDDPATRYSSFDGSSGDSTQDNLVKYNADGQPVDSLVPLNMFRSLHVASGASGRKWQLSWDSPSHELTVTVETDFEMYIQGRLITVSAGDYTDDSWTPAGTGEDDQVFRWIADFSEVTPSISVGTSGGANTVRCTDVYSNATDGLVLLTDTTPPGAFPEAAETFFRQFWSGVQVVDGGYPEDWTLDTEGDNNVRFDMGDLDAIVIGSAVGIVNSNGGEAWGYPFETGSGFGFAEMPVLHTTATGFDLSENGSGASFPFLIAGTGRVAYDNSGSQTEASDGNYVPYFIVATNCPYAPLMMIQGMTDSDDLNFMRRYSWKDHVGGGGGVPDNLSIHIIGRVIFQTDDTFTTGTCKVKIAAYDDYRRVATPYDPTVDDLSHWLLDDVAQDVHKQYGWRRAPTVLLTGGSTSLALTKEDDQSIVAATSLTGDASITLPKIEDSDMTGYTVLIESFEGTYNVNIAAATGGSGDIIFVPKVGTLMPPTAELETDTSGSSVVFVAYYAGANSYWLATSVLGTWYDPNAGTPEDTRGVFWQHVPSGAEGNLTAIGPNRTIIDSTYTPDDFDPYRSYVLSVQGRQKTSHLFQYPVSNDPDGRIEEGVGVTWSTTPGGDYGVIVEVTDPPDWEASTAYSLNDLVQSTAGDHYECTTAGTSGGTEPTWDTDIGDTTSDGGGTLVWTRVEDYKLASHYGKAMGQGLRPIVVLRKENVVTEEFYVPGTFGDDTQNIQVLWAATTAYSLGDVVRPAAEPAECYVCTTAGTSGASEPTWNTGVGDTTSDGGGTLVWTRVLNPDGLLHDDNGQYFKWRRGKANIAAVEVRCTDADSTSDPKLYMLFNGRYPFVTGLLDVDETWRVVGSFGLAFTEQDIDYGDFIELYITLAGGTGDAENLTVLMTFIME